MTPEYPTDWDNRRKRVYQRDEYKCQNCGIQQSQDSDVELHAHHIVPKSRGGSHQMSNLITLCKDCHTAVHNEVLAPNSIQSKQHSVDPFDSESDWAKRYRREIIKDADEQVVAENVGFKNCPFCQGSMEAILDKNAVSLTNTIFCTECDSVFILKQEDLMIPRWEMVSSSHPAEGTKLSSEIWDGFAEADCQPEDACELEELGKKQAKLEKYLLFGGSIGFVLLAFIIGWSGEIVIAILTLIAAIFILTGIAKLTKIRFRRIASRI